MYFGIEGYNILRQDEKLNNGLIYKNKENTHNNNSIVNN